MEKDTVIKTLDELKTEKNISVVSENTLNVFVSQKNYETIVGETRTEKGKKVKIDANFYEIAPNKVLSIKYD